jgi:NAD(P)-dependent dehydrogenase (short-subunit alcohol dehydrogenase family)
MTAPLHDKVALVAGATRGAGRGTAAALGEAGATVYCTGRTTRQRRSEYDRPETIEETAEMVSAAGGSGIAVAVDHLEPDAVQALIERIDTEQGRLDVLVNDIWGAELLFEWDKPLWEHDLRKGLRILRLAVETHLVTSHFALPLLIRRPGGLVVGPTAPATTTPSTTASPPSTTLRRRRSSGWPSRRAASSPRTDAPPWRSPRGGCGQRSCSAITGSPRRTGATAPP